MFSWTGFYIGAHAGYGWGNNDFSDTTGFVGPAGTSYGNDTDGFFGGGQAGFDYQFAPNWVLGIEGQMSGGKIDGGTNYVPALGTTAFSNDAKWLASVTGRLGFTPGGSNWLIYGKGGVAFADIDQTVSIPGFSVSNSETRTGWTAGAGVEYAFAPGWSGKIEYQYYDFGSETYDFSPTAFAGSVRGRHQLPHHQGRHQLALRWSGSRRPLNAHNTSCRENPGFRPGVFSCRHHRHADARRP